jgi:hypothetical protein
VTVVAADALGEALAGEQPNRDQIRADVQQAVREAVAGARQAADAQRAATDMARLSAELDRARDAVAQAQGGGAAGGNLSITREGNNVVIHTPDGRTITLDQSIVPPPAIEGLVSSLGQPPMPPPFPTQDGPPRSVIELVSVIFVCLTIMVVGWSWARAFARRAEARAAKGAGVGPDTPLRLERIEQAVDAMAVELERVSEAQRYSARLLTERLPESWQQLAAATAPQQSNQSTP